MNLERAAKYNKSSAKNFNTKIKSGVRKIHDMTYDKSCDITGVGSTSMCKIFTNSGVPNSEMTRILAKRRAKNPASLVPKFMCAHTMAEQIVASVVEKTISNPPHSTPSPETDGKLRALWVMLSQ
jgi:hypothetical protein